MAIIVSAYDCANILDRIPEMAGGWGNSLMRNEAEFMILDGASVLQRFLLAARANIPPE